MPSTGLQTQQSFVLDSANNWLRVKSGLKWLETAPDASHAYATVPDGIARYDQDGRQIKAGETAYRYDAFGRLAEVRIGTATCTYDYDALGRRVRELCNGKETLFGYSGDNLVVEQQGTTATATIHAGLSAPVARVPLANPTQRMYIVTGKDGSVRAMLNSAGAVVETYSYTAFGETTIRQKPKQAPTGNRFGFQGAYRDPNTGLYQMRARYYAPRWGRFLTPDPLGVAATGNPYAFVGNRPGDFWDPFGLSPVANPNGQSMNLANPFIPNRDPITYAILYSDSFILEHTLQDDRELEVAQNGWMLVSGLAATGGLALEAYGAGAVVYTGLSESFAANGGMAAVRMGMIRAGMMTEDAAAAFAGNTGTTAGTVYMATRAGSSGGSGVRVAEELLEEASGSGEARVAEEVVESATRGGGDGAVKAADRARQAISALSDDLFQPLECTQCATTVQEALQAQGLKGEVLNIRARSGADFIVNDLVDAGRSSITRNGFHQAIRVGDTVFDNYFRNGVPFDQYVRSLHARFGVDITTIAF